MYAIANPHCLSDLLNHNVMPFRCLVPIERVSFTPFVGVVVCKLLDLFLEKIQ